MSRILAAVLQFNHCAMKLLLLALHEIVTITVKNINEPTGRDATSVAARNVTAKREDVVEKKAICCHHIQYHRSATYLFSQGNKASSEYSCSYSG